MVLYLKLYTKKVSIIKCFQYKISFTYLKFTYNFTYSFLFCSVTGMFLPFFFNSWTWKLNFLLDKDKHKQVSYFISTLFISSCLPFQIFIIVRVLCLTLMTPKLSCSTLKVVSMISVMLFSSIHFREVNKLGSTASISIKLMLLFSNIYKILYS